MSSEVSLLRKRIEEEYVAACNGVKGIASVARHEFIARRYACIETLHTQLAAKVGVAAATQIVSEISDRVVE